MKGSSMTTTLISSILIAALSLGDLSAQRDKQTSPKTAAPAWNPSQTSQASKPDEPAQARASEAYAKLPLSFEANHGQTDSQVKFLSRGGGYTLFLTPTEAVLTLRQDKGERREDVVKSKADSSLIHRPARLSTLRMRLAGASSHPQVTGSEELPGKVNYFIGDDPKQWRADVPTYARVEYRQVYPGVDLAYYGAQRQLEYDFIVAPDANPNAIELAFQGADKLEINAEGDLVIGIDGAEVIQRAPVSYQEIDGVRRAITSRYELRDGRRVGFEVGPYDTSRTLVIDPMLIYSTFLGGRGYDQAFAIAVDSQGAAYVTGDTTSNDFPTISGASYTSNNGSADVFISKLNPQGSALIYSTFLGGASADSGKGIAVDSQGIAYVAGITGSANFPTTLGAFNMNHSGGWDCFVTKLNAMGRALVYSTFLGGSGADHAEDIAVDSQDSAYVGGWTSSANFPTTMGAFDTTHNGGYDCFVTKLDAIGGNIVYSTFLGSPGGERVTDIALSSDLALVTGFTDSANFPTTIGAFDRSHNGATDCFVSKLDATGGSLVYSTFLGGAGYDGASGIAVNSQGIAYVAGSTDSLNFPTTMGVFDRSHNGSNDCFVTKLDAMGSNLVYSTFLGGLGYDSAYDISLQGDLDLAIVTGVTNSTNFPVVNPIQRQIAGYLDAFVAKLNAQGSNLAFSTFLGGGGNENSSAIAVDANGAAFVAGSSASNNFPTVFGSLDRTHNGSFDAIVFKLTTGP